jgi:hypothetical protein
MREGLGPWAEGESILILSPLTSVPLSRRPGQQNHPATAPATTSLLLTSIPQSRRGGETGLVGRAPIEPEPARLGSFELEPSLARAAFSSARMFRAEPSRARAGGTARLGFFEPSRAGSNFFYSHVRSPTFLVRTLESISLCHTHFLVQDVIGTSTNNGALRY